MGDGAQQLVHGLGAVRHRLAGGLNVGAAREVVEPRARRVREAPEDLGALLADPRDVRLQHLGAVAEDDGRVLGEARAGGGREADRHAVQRVGIALDGGRLAGGRVDGEEVQALGDVEGGADELVALEEDELAEVGLLLELVHEVVVRMAPVDGGVEVGRGPQHGLARDVVDDGARADGGVVDLEGVEHAHRHEDAVARARPEAALHLADDAEVDALELAVDVGDRLSVVRAVEHQVVEAVVEGGGERPPVLGEAFLALHHRDGVEQRLRHDVEIDAAECVGAVREYGEGARVGVHEELAAIGDGLAAAAERDGELAEEGEEVLAEGVGGGGGARPVDVGQQAVAAPDGAQARPVAEPAVLVALEKRLRQDRGEQPAHRVGDGAGGERLGDDGPQVDGLLVEGAAVLGAEPRAVRRLLEARQHQARRPAAPKGLGPLE